MSHDIEYPNMYSLSEPTDIDKVHYFKKCECGNVFGIVYYKKDELKLRTMCPVCEEAKKKKK